MVQAKPIIFDKGRGTDFCGRKNYTGSLYMSEQKKQFSVLCLAGFLLSVSPVLLMLISNFTPAALTDIFPVAFLVLPLAGFIVSIAGLISARIEGQKGKGFAIAGIALPSAAVTAVVAVIVFILSASSGTTKELAKNEMFRMGEIRDAVNTEYDVSQYKMTKEFDFKSLGITTSETELKDYAETKLDKISKKTDKSIRGEWQGYNFLIVRSDRYDEWLSANLGKNFGGARYDGYTSIGYGDYWEIAAVRYYTLAVYKDPSNKFVIITNCNDYKIISEFFG